MNSPDFSNIFGEIFADPTGTVALRDHNPELRDHFEERIVRGGDFRKAAKRTAWWAIVATAWGLQPRLGAVAYVSCSTGYLGIVHIEPLASQCDFFDCLFAASMAMTHLSDYEPEPQSGVLLECGQETITNEIARVLGALDVRGCISALVDDFRRQGYVPNLETRIRELLPDLPDLAGEVPA